MLASNDDDCARRHSTDPGEQLSQSLVGGAIDWRRGEANEKGISANSRDSGLRCARNDSEGD